MHELFTRILYLPVIIRVKGIVTKERKFGQHYWNHAVDGVAAAN